MSRWSLFVILAVACSPEEDPPHYATGDSTHLGDTHVGDTHGGDFAGDTHVGDTHYIVVGDGGDAVRTDLCVFPGVVVFPPPAIGVPASTSAFSFATVSITNCGTEDVQVQAPALTTSTDPEFAIDFAPWSGTTTLVRWETALVELIFTPEVVATNFSGGLEIPYGSGQTITVPLSGASVTDPGTCLLQLGPTLASAANPLASLMQAQPTQVGAGYNDTFMLVNIGRTPCAVSDVQLAGDSVFSFPYPTQITTPINLAFRQLRVINLRFEPTSTGIHTATVTMLGGDGAHTMSVSAQAY